MVALSPRSEHACQSSSMAAQAFSFFDMRGRGFELLENHEVLCAGSLYWSTHALRENTRTARELVPTLLWKTTTPSNDWHSTNWLLRPAALTNQPGEALENGDIARVSRNEEFLELLRCLSSDKIDFATAHLLSHWDSLSGGDEVSYAPSRLRSKMHEHTA